MAKFSLQLVGNKKTMKHSSESPKKKDPPKGPESLHIYISNVCNLRCIYCLPEDRSNPSSMDEALNPAELARIVRVALGEGVSRVEILGGEPLMRKDLSQFCNEAIKMEGLSQLMITTNGILLEENLAILIRAGIKHLTVCLDTLNPDKYQKFTHGDNLYRVMGGLKKAEKEGLRPIRINVLIIKGVNEEESIDFALLTKDHPYIVKFIGYQPALLKNKEDDVEPITAEEIRDRVSSFQQLVPLKLKETEKIVCYRFQDAVGRIELFDPSEEHQCDRCTKLGMTADGLLQSCILGDGKVDLKEILRNRGDDYEIVKAIRKAFRYKPKTPPAGIRMFKRCTWISK